MHDLICDIIYYCAPNDVDVEKLNAYMKKS